VIRVNEQSTANNAVASSTKGINTKKIYLIENKEV